MQANGSVNVSGKPNKTWILHEDSSFDSMD